MELLKEEVAAGDSGGAVSSGNCSNGDNGKSGSGGSNAVPPVVVGYAFMAKKMERMDKIVGQVAAAAGAGGGIVFRPLDLSQELEAQGSFDVLLHKLSEDIMNRHSSAASAAKLARMERYLARNRTCACADPVDAVSVVINRVSTLEALSAARARHGAAGGMPRPPRYTVVEAGAGPAEIGARIAAAGLAYPLICKPIAACGTQGSHTMLVVLDAASLDAVTVPIVAQEYCNHDAWLFKVCVVGDDVQMTERPSLPNLPPGLTGSLSFDSQKPYPTVADFARQCAGNGCSAAAGAAAAAPEHHGHFARECTANGKAVAAAAAAAAEQQDGLALRCAAAGSAAVATEAAAVQGAAPALPLAAARAAAARLREAFGLSLFGFDLIVERGSGDVVVIDVNYFPSFRDFEDFPGALRAHLRSAAAEARARATAAPATAHAAGDSDAAGGAAVAPAAAPQGVVGL